MVSYLSEVAAKTNENTVCPLLPAGREGEGAHQRGHNEADQQGHCREGENQDGEVHVLQLSNHDKVCSSEKSSTNSSNIPGNIIMLKILNILRFGIVIDDLVVIEQFEQSRWLGYQCNSRQKNQNDEHSIDSTVLFEKTETEYDRNDRVAKDDGGSVTNRKSRKPNENTHHG